MLFYTLESSIIDTIGSVDDLIENYDQSLKKLIEFGDTITNSIKTQLEITKLCNISLGGTPSRKKNEFWGGVNRWLNSGAVTNTPVIIKESEYITDEGIRKSATKSGGTGDTVLSIMEPDETKISLLSDDFYFNQSTALLKAHKTIHQGSLYFGIRKSMSVIKLLKNGAAQQSINKEILSNSSIPFSENYNDQLNLIKNNMISIALKIDVLKKLKKQLLDKFF